ncbi:MAG: hypothetical protein LBC18_00030, partial [Opitutaceae bacterium]|nr:hypothetical protein [Opitutaceae bacterium]
MAFLPMVLIGVGAGGAKDLSYLKDRRMLKAYGLTEEGIRLMESSADAESAAAMLRSIRDNPKLRDPGSAEAKAAMAELSAALAAQAESAKANGGMATVRRRGAGFEVRDRRGKSLGRTEDFGEAWKLKTLYDMPDALFADESEAGGAGNKVDPMSPAAMKWEDASGEQATHDNAALDAVASRFKGKDGAGGVTLRVVNWIGNRGAVAGVAGEAGAGGAETAPGAERGQAAVAGLAGFVSTFEQAFGKRVVFFRASKEIRQNGFFLPWEANTIWINADANAPAQAIAGHEFSHSIKAQNPKLWEKVRALVAQVAPMPDSYREGRAKDYDASRIEEEWVSDAIGQHFDQPIFWEKLREVAGKRGMEAEFKGFVQTVLDWLDKFVMRFRRVLNNDADATTLRDVEDLRDGLAEMLVDYVAEMPEGGYPGIVSGAMRDSAMFESVTDETPAEQVAAVRSKYEGTAGWMKAPNGKATNLTERQWLAVRTENFKRWFGDWENDPENASRALDENGEPVVVWRADRKHLRAFGAGPASGHWGRTGWFDAWYFTDSKALADRDRRGHYMTAHTRGFFLNLRKPVEADAGGATGTRFLDALDEARAGGGGGAIISNV